MATLRSVAMPLLRAPRAVGAVRTHTKHVKGKYKMGVRKSVSTRIRVTEGGALKRWQMGHRHGMRVRSGNKNRKRVAAMVVSTNNNNYINACKMLGVSPKMGRHMQPKASANTAPRTPQTLWQRVQNGEHLHTN